jgi:hypothetical protein
MMAKGFQGNTPFKDLLTADQRRLAEKLARIEEADANACANCGGEDCICCEIYHDRQKWVSPEELWGEDDLYADEFDGIEFEEDDEDE